MIVTRAQIIEAGGNATSYWWSTRLAERGSRVIKNNLCYVYDTIDIRVQLGLYLKTVKKLSDFNKARTTATCMKVLKAITILENRQAVQS
jgi:hypothetical protein